MALLSDSQRYLLGLAQHALTMPRMCIQHRPFLTTGAVLVLLPVVAIAYVIARVSCTALYHFVRLHVFHADPFQHVPRPKSSFTPGRLFLGDTSEIHGAVMGVPQRRWFKELNSSVICYRGELYGPRLLVADPLAISHILSSAQSYDFPKTVLDREFLARLIGPGIIVAEGDAHKAQKKVLSPAFSTSAIKDLVPIFWKHARRLTDKLGEMVDGTEGRTQEAMSLSQTELAAKASITGKPVTDITWWLSRTTLDIIGEAGFDEDFGTMAMKDGQAGHEMAESFNSLIGASSNFSPLSIILFILGRYISVFEYARRQINPQTKAMEKLLASMNRVALDIVHRKREQIIRTMEENGLGANGKLRKSDWEDVSAGSKVDILHQMMKTNMSSDVKDSNRLSDDDILAQISNFLLAGHETTATAMSWILFYLAGNLEVQDKVRAEVQEHMSGRNELSYDGINALPWVDAVVRESLRLTPPVFSLQREARVDKVIPLSKPYPREDGKGTFDKLLIPKGMEFIIPIELLNTSEDVWGPDALAFRPQRWFNLPTEVNNDFDFPLHLATFIAGPRGCIGSRFAVIEAKVLLMQLVSVFRFERVLGWTIEPKLSLVTRSRVVGQEKAGPQMPLRISRV
ncbi:cytochrome P450 [Tilletiaria anomala UBC 951]|uniref:Cytochrome P450 n=1 Tax=Tilletiaria anomala (strain ATCC 24038 / CBS 436.72 / UBC 951) TaxID=1037660 RepID=A0A066WQ22_TILAU|nr:cytochrome P450 [Tilletiaria anomala UBC 951]KDN52725.1 cytochrome P450 [Tilletiaria anomala UBC 951]